MTHLHVPGHGWCRECGDLNVIVPAEPPFTDEERAVSAEMVRDHRIAELEAALRAIVAATDNATDRGAPASQWLVRVGGLRPFHDAIEQARAVLEGDRHG